MSHLLLVDDDRELGAMLSQYLVREGFRVDTAEDGETALRRALTEDFDLIVLDVMMPGMSGLDVLRALRAHRVTPVLMLTARGDDVDSIVGLELGADDYLAKPCNPRVLVARIHAVLRRGQGQTDMGEQARQFRLGDLVLNVGDRTVRLGDCLLPMTSTEFGILEVLVREAGKAVTKNDLSVRALGRALGRYDRSLDMHLSNLRHKLGPLPNGEERIKTVRGIGYQYVLS